MSELSRRELLLGSAGIAGMSFFQYIGRSAENDAVSDERQYTHVVSSPVTLLNGADFRIETEDRWDSMDLSVYPVSLRLRIGNRSDQPLLFPVSDTFELILYNTDGSQHELDGGRNGTRPVMRPLLLDPGQDYCIVPSAGNITYMDQLVGKLIEAVDKAGLGHNTLIVFTGDNGSAAAGKLNGKPFEKGKGREADRGAHVPFVVRAPFLTPGGRLSRDLIDFTDLYPTFLELAKTAPPKDVTLDGRSFVPSLRGSEDPFEKRNWIFSQIGDFRMIRDWQHIVDNKGNFHDLTKDPLQQSEVSPLDKIAPGRRQRLEAILNRFPKNGPAPFPEYEARYRTGTKVE